MNKPITLCDRCDYAFSCLLNYDGEPCRKNRTVEPTNADRLRAMSDEELAEWFDLHASEPLWCTPPECPEHEECVKCILNWLKSTVVAENG